MPKRTKETGTKKPPKKKKSEEESAQGSSSGATAPTGGFAPFDSVDQHLEKSALRNKNKKLICIYWNVYGLKEQFRNRMGGFGRVVDAIDPDILLMNEIKISEENLIKVIKKHFQGYGYVLLPSTESPACRGVVILVKGGDTETAKKYNGGFRKYHVKKVPENSYKPDFEIAWADVTFGDADYRFSCFYFANSESGRISTSEFTTMKQYITENKKENAINIVCGDKNLRDTADKNYTDWFASKAHGNSIWYTMLNTEWTTNRSQKSNSTIDCVMTTPAGRKHVLCHKPIEPSDVARAVHKPIFFEVSSTMNPSESWCSKGSCK